ncbi:MAG: hypothetical protein GY851_32040 [bacterium]|nr:hypothetical protein [bacterium]
MLFRKRKKHGIPANVRSMSDGEPGNPAFYHITFESMLKGSVMARRGKQIRQFGLSHKGLVRLITSGDTVDKETYEALLAAGVVKRLDGDEPDGPEQTPPGGGREPVSSKQGCEE